MKKLYAFLLFLFLLLFILIVGLLRPAGYFKSIQPHFNGEVLNVYTEAYGPEDIEVDHENGLLFISSTYRGAAIKPTSPNGIYSLDLDDESASPTFIHTDYSRPMFFHGISLMHIDSMTYVYAINHINDEDFIELFRYENDSLHFVKSYSDPLMISPNDIVGVSLNEFYITNDHTSDDAGQDTKEDFLRFKNRNIIHQKNDVYTEVANNLSMPNGINISHDGYILYCATTLGGNLVTYSRDRASGDLEEITRTDLDTGLDNIDIDIDGNIWIGAHPKLLDFLGHAKDQSKLSPSQILRLTPLSTIGEYDVTEMYMDDGSTISGSSVGVRYKNELIIGDVFDNKIVRARMR